MKTNAPSIRTVSDHHTPHTPAPWGGAFGPTERTENQANARLIAAAPDLLAALKVCLPYLSKVAGDYANEGTDANSRMHNAIADRAVKTYRIADAAICKAEGRILNCDEQKA